MKSKVLELITTLKIKKRPYFDSGQIKDHFGKAIVKVLELKSDNENCDVAIAHPDDESIKKILKQIN